MVNQFVEVQTEWISSQESLIIEQMMAFVDERMRIELSCTERLVAMINSCIEDNIPIRHQWQLASDAIVVRKDRLVYPPPDPLVMPAINEFQPSHFNDEQIEYTVDMLNSLQMGGQLLLEDFMSWINLCQSGVGPLGHCFGSDGTYYSLVLPKIWRNDREDFTVKLFQTEGIPGFKETTGVIGVETVLHNMQAYGEERYIVLKKWTGSL